MKRGSWSLKATPFRVVSWEVRRKDRLPGKDCLGFTEVVGTLGSELLFRPQSDSVRQGTCGVCIFRGWAKGTKRWSKAEAVGRERDTLCEKHQEGKTSGLVLG